MTARAMATWALVLAVAAVLVGLGTWQLQRRTWKEDLLASIDARAKLPPATGLPLADCRPADGPADPCEYRPVSLTVTFDGFERHVFIAVPQRADGFGGPGFWVFARAALADGGSLYVNRGFVPQRFKEPVSRKDVAPAGPMAVTGVLRRAEARGRLSGANDPLRNVYYVRDPAEFDDCPDCRPRRVSLQDYYLDMQAPVPPGGLPRPMVGTLAIPNRHLEYALTWYALALTWLVIAWLRLRRPAVNAD
jgi:surfeit locus 1 family protein